MEKTDIKPTKRRTVKRSELSTIRMVAGGEKRIDRVIIGDRVHNWVGFGWVDEGKATKANFKKYPTVED